MAWNGYCRTERGELTEWPGLGTVGQRGRQLIEWPGYGSGIEREPVDCVT